jgi:hypothetical protein
VKFTIIVPEKVSLNTAMRKHYKAVNAMKQEWHYAVLEANPEPWDGPYPVDILFHYRLRGKRIDSTNAGFMSKALEDALVTAGVLPDDNPHFVRRSCNQTDQDLKAEYDTVEVTISTVCG